MDIYQIVTLAIALVATVFGVNYFTKFKMLIKELKEAFDALHEALEDDSITKEELLAIVKEFIDVAKVFIK